MRSLIRFSRKEDLITVMIIGNKINQLRKLAGMTQEQLAEKLNVSRQTISKWEAGASVPDLESVLTISRMFQVPLDDLLLEEETPMEKQEKKITLEDLVKINLHNRNMMLLLTAGLLFIMMSILSIIFIAALSYTTNSTQYMLYRYIAVGEYASVPVNYLQLLLPSIGSGILGILLCVCCFLKTGKLITKTGKDIG